MLNTSLAPTQLFVACSIITTKVENVLYVHVFSQVMSAMAK